MEHSSQENERSATRDVSRKERFFLTILDPDLEPLERLPTNNRCVLKCDYLGMPAVFTYPSSPAEKELFTGDLPGLPRMIKQYETFGGDSAHLRAYYPATLQDAYLGKNGWRLDKTALSRNGTALLAAEDLYSQLATTMGLAHGAGYSCLDFTPRNVFLTEEGTPVLGELSHALRAEGSLDACLKELDRRDFQQLFSAPKPVSSAATYLADYLRKNR